MKLLLIIWLICFFSNSYGQALRLPLPLQGKIPFDFEALALPPDFAWENQQDSVWSLLYEGETSNDQPTEVFAYYASPATFSGKKAGDKKYPAVVLVHGGGGTAFAVWVREWARKGFAAIAMDLGGARPFPESEQQHPWSTHSEPLPKGAPDDTNGFKFMNIEKSFKEQWQFHAVSNIIRAHSLIRSFADTDTTQTALTGISWGGYLTNIVAGIDQRFKAAVPVYGCGFLQEKSAWLAQFDTLGLERSKKWIELWEPSSFVAHAGMPMLFINGTNDFFYYVESWQKTIDLMPDASQLLIFQMEHNHKDGAAPAEIETFVKGAFSGKQLNPVLKTPKKIGKWFESDIVHGNQVAEARFIFTKESKNNKERKWETAPASLLKNTVLAEGANDIKAAYFLVIDQEGNRMSSPVYFN
jgi:dienelactone hydrolase